MDSFPSLTLNFKMILILKVFKELKEQAGKRNLQKIKCQDPGNQSCQGKKKTISNCIEYSYKEACASIYASKIIWLALCNYCFPFCVLSKRKNLCPFSVRNQLLIRTKKSAICKQQLSPDVIFPNHAVGYNRCTKSEGEFGSWPLSSYLSLEKKI